MGRELSREKFLTDSEVLHLEQVLKRNESDCFRDTTFIWALLHSGARVSEVLGIRPKDLHDEGGVVFLSGLKNSRDRELPFRPWLYDRLKVLAQSKGPDESIFPFGYNRAREIWAFWRPVKKRIHSIRHYRAQEIYKRTNDVRVVQRVLGHRYISTTMIYLEYEHSVDELRAAMIP